MKAIIIDDIEQARLTLRQDLKLYAPDVEIIAEADGVIEGAKILKANKPDVVFLDIQMRDGSGFDLLDILPEIPFKIIFITASDAHAIKALRYAAVDYLLKPIDPDELKAALETLRKKQIDEQEKYQLLNENLRNHSKPGERLALHAQDKISVVKIAEIVRCESQVNYTQFYFSNSKKTLVSKTLKEFEDLLTEHGFYRVHQSHLINVNFIKEYVKIDGGHILMTDGSIIPVATRKKQDVLKMLEGI